MNALEIQGLRKQYRQGTEAVKGIDLTIKKGDFFALLGANGAGKSTTIGMISTLVQKTSGRIRIAGYDIDHDTARAKQCLGLVPQEVNLNVFEPCERILLNQAGYYGLLRSEVRERVHALLHQLSLWEHRHKIVRHLSGGMKRRLMIARALVHDPDILILDEPTAGVDVEIRREMWDFLTALNDAGKTLILTTHYLEEAERLCKHIGIIHQGKLIHHSTMQALLRQLKHHTYIVTTETPQASAPPLSFGKATYIDAHTFELTLNPPYRLNTIFEELSRANIMIQSFQHKTNRLEALYMDLIHHAD